MTYTNLFNQAAANVLEQNMRLDEFKARVGYAEYHNCFNTLANAQGFINTPRSIPDPEALAEYAVLYRDRQNAEQAFRQVKAEVYNELYIQVEKQMPGLGKYISIEFSCDCGTGGQGYAKAAQYLDVLRGHA